MNRLLILIVLLIISCAPPAGNFPSLSNTGILGLSTTNAYLGSNLFLGEELGRSRTLYGFFKGRGAPTAIEIIETDFAPPHIIMYYPKDQEVFVADLLQKKKSRDWIVRGPYGIQRKDFRQLMQMASSMIGEPVFVVNGEEERFGVKTEKSAKIVLRPNIVPTPTAPPPKIKRPISNKEGTATSHSSEAPKATPFQPLNTDQQAIAMSKGFAWRAPNGDILHTVRGETESLEQIAKWYTGSDENAKKLAEVNSLALGSPLTLGSKIRVPLAIIKEFKRMPQE